MPMAIDRNSSRRGRICRKTEGDIMPCLFAMCVFIGSSPQMIISEGTDWRFFNELKRELKA